MTTDALKRIRQTIKDDYGAGWTIADSGGLLKLGYKRLAFKTFKQVKVENTKEFRRTVEDLIDHFHCCLGSDKTPKEAFDSAQNQVLCKDPQQVLNWDVVIQDYLSRKKGLVSAETFRTHYYNKAMNIRKAFAHPLGIKDTRQVAEILIKVVGEGNGPGSDGRTRYLDQLNGILRLAVTDYGADPVKFRQLKGEERKEVFGTKKGYTQKTPPIMSDDFVAYMDHLEKIGKHELRNYFVLLCCWGLRPSEPAGFIKVKDLKKGVIEVSNELKSNTSTKGKDVKWTDVYPIPPKNRPDIWRQVLRNYAEKGIECFPDQIQTAAKSCREQMEDGEKGGWGAVSERLKNLVKADSFWLGLKEQTPGLTLYSFRHSYAYRSRCELEPPLHHADTAVMMRHDVITHLKHYGQWTQQDAIFDRIQKGLASKNDDDIVDDEED